MKKSLYQDASFAAYWNERAGTDGEAYKRYVLDPLMFGLVGDFKNKSVIELGCGNGYLAPKFLQEGVSSLVMIDISEHNLRYAAEKCADPRVGFLEQDATKPWKLHNEAYDVVYSNMMLNEVENIKTPIAEACRILRPGGVFVFSVTHPAWDLYMFAQEKTGSPSKKIKGLSGYFKRGYAKFLMGGDSRTNPSLIEKYQGEPFEVEHFQRPIQDYFDQLVGAGFSVKRMIEPELNEEILRNNPRFADYSDNPIGLVFYCYKPIN